MYHNQQWIPGDLDNWCDVDDRIVLELVEAWVSRITGRDQCKRVTVGRGLEPRFHPDGTAGAGPVLDNELLPERRGEALRHDAANKVIAASGCEGHDDPHRLGGVATGPRLETMQR